MNLPGINPENNLPGYDIARMTGYGAPDFDFKALGAAMDCTREVYQAGIIYADGAQCYLVRPGQRHPDGQSGIVTHLIVTKTPKQATASDTGKSRSKAVSATSMGTEIASNVFSLWCNDYHNWRGGYRRFTNTYYRWQ